MTPAAERVRRYRARQRAGRRCYIVELAQAGVEVLIAAAGAVLPSRWVWGARLR